MNFATVGEYAKKLVDEKLCEKGDYVAFKQDGVIFVSKENANLANLGELDFVIVDEKMTGEYAMILKIFTTKNDINALYHTHPKWVNCVAKKGVTIPAVLDDMAQIIGPTCKTAKNGKWQNVLKALNGRNSCLIKDDGCITTGRTLDEAYTCALVLDKASRCFVAGSVLGGNKIIPYIEAKLMQIVYKKKYSKVNQKELQERED